MRYLKKQNIICFTPIELRDLYRDDKKEKLREILVEKRLKISELNNNYPKKKEIVDALVKKDLKHKEQIEIFSALNSCIVFYGEDSEIGFPLKDSYNIEKNPIKSLAELKGSVKEETLIDFVIVSNSNIYQFQFKQYKGVLETKEFFCFVERILKKYGNILKKINLLIIIQGLESAEMQKLNINFKKIKKELLVRNIDFGGSILVRFNEGNKFNHLIEIYPGRFTVKNPIDPNYLAGELLYF